MTINKTFKCKQKAGGVRGSDYEQFVTAVTLVRRKPALAKFS